MAAKIPYIGSKISLISKAAIRYEGTLYTINPYEATVALANVRSFGTEDREANLVVPPREEVYEYIIFRGSDIRDIHVCEPPPPTPPHDPAIVESSQPKPIGSDSSCGHGGLPGATSGYAAFSHLNRPPPGGSAPGSGRLPPQLSQHQPFPQPVPSNQSSTPAATTARTESVGRQTPTQDQSTQVSQTALKKSSQQGSKPASKNGSRGSTPTHERHSPERQYDRRKQHHQNGPPQQRRFNDRGGFHDSSRGGYEHRGGYEPRGAWRGGDRGYDRGGDRGMDRGGDRGEGGWRDQHQRGREFRPRGGGRGGGPRPEHGEFVPHSGPPRGRGGMRGRGRGGMGGNKPQKLTFDEDFDFDAANAQFNKEDLEKELREKLSLGEPADGEKAVNGDDGGAASGSEDESEIYYDKDNFFDNISCEASDREKGKRSRPNWKEERKTNTETFGLSSTRDLRYYGRGGMRGRGGPYRGGPYRGGGGRGGGWGPRGGGRGGYGPRGGGRGGPRDGPRDGPRPFRSNDGSKIESGPKEVETHA